MLSASGKPRRPREGGPQVPGSQAPPPPRPGLPKEDSVVEEKPFVSPKGRRYRILRTDETDPYDKPAGPPKRPR